LFGLLVGALLTVRYLGILGSLSIQDAQNIASVMKFVILLNIVFAIAETTTGYLVGHTTMKGLINGAGVGSSLVLLPIFGIQFP